MRSGGRRGLTPLYENCDENFTKAEHRERSNQARRGVAMIRGVGIGVIAGLVLALALLAVDGVGADPPGDEPLSSNWRQFWYDYVASLETEDADQTTAESTPTSTPVPNINADAHAHVGAHVDAGPDADAGPHGGARGHANAGACPAGLRAGDAGAAGRATGVPDREAHGAGRLVPRTGVRGRLPAPVGGAPHHADSGSR